jgi:hypothetical protein
MLWKLARVFQSSVDAGNEVNWDAFEELIDLTLR